VSTQSTRLIAARTEHFRSALFVSGQAIDFDGYQLLKKVYNAENLRVIFVLFLIQPTLEVMK
jgi:hypothetical protein